MTVSGCASQGKRSVVIPAFLARLTRDGADPDMEFVGKEGPPRRASDLIVGLRTHMGG